MYAIKVNYWTERGVHVTDSVQSVQTMQSGY